MLLVVFGKQKCHIGKENFTKQALNFPVSASLSVPQKSHYYISKQSERRW